MSPRVRAVGHTIARTIGRAIRAPAVVIALYGILRLAFAALTRQEGLLSPEATVSPGLMLVGALLLLFRLLVLFALPAWLGYRIVARASRGRVPPP